MSIGIQRRNNMNLDIENKSSFTIHEKKLKEFILSVLQENNIICSTPIELPNKDSYGDLDVIYYQSSVIGPVDLKKFIQTFKTAFNFIMLLIRTNKYSKI